MKNEIVDQNRLLEIVSGKAELKKKVNIGKSLEEAGRTDTKKWPRSLEG